MKKHLIPVATVAAAILSATAANRQADPIVMTVNGKDIKQSEFEYLYNKNNLQQATPQSLEEYVDMFVVYKLKPPGLTPQRHFVTNITDIAPSSRLLICVTRLWNSVWSMRLTAACRVRAV